MIAIFQLIVVVGEREAGLSLLIQRKEKMTGFMDGVTDRECQDQNLAGHPTFTT